MHEYGYNTDFLDPSNDCELRSYFLGYFVADGWLSSQKQVRISSADKQIIDDLAKATDYTNKIMTQQNHKYGSSTELTGTTQYSLGYTGPITWAIERLGFTPKKSGREFIPAGISDETFHHFYRGYSDGDGLIGLYSDTKYGKTRRYLRHELCCFLPSFLQQMLDKLRKLSIIASTCVVKPSRTAYKFSLSHVDTIRVCNWMYQGATIKLERKHQVYLAGKDIPYRQSKWTPAELEMLRKGINPPGRTAKACGVKRSRLKAKGLLVS